MRPSIQPFFSFSSSSSNPIHEAFNATLPLHANLHNPALPLHDGSLHLHLFSPAISPSPSSPSSSSSSPPRHPSPSSSPSSSNPTLLLLFFLLRSHHSPPFTPLPSPPILPLSSFSSSSSNPIHKAFNVTLPLHADLHYPILPFHSGSLHRPFSIGDPSFPLFPFLLIILLPSLFPFSSSFYFFSSSNHTLLLLFFLLQSYP